MPRKLSAFAGSRAATIAAAVLLSITALGSIGADLYTRFSAANVARRRGFQQYFSNIRRDSASPFGEGIFIYFDRIPPQFQDYKAMFDFGAAYAIFPRPVLASEPSTPIRNVDDLNASNFLPTRRWLVGHNLCGILWCYMQSGTPHANFVDLSRLAR